MMIMQQLMKPKAPEPTEEPEIGSGSGPEIDEEFVPLPASDYQEVCNLKTVEEKVISGSNPDSHVAILSRSRVTKSSKIFTLIATRAGSRLTSRI